MKPDRTQRTIRPAAPRCGFSILEAMMCIVLVSVAMTAAMSVAGAARLVRVRGADRVNARLLAHDLLAEIMAMPYADPDTPAVALGREPSETAGDRATFDDVDDYRDYEESTLRTRDGSVVAAGAGFRRETEVDWVTAANPEQVSAAETGLKRIIVRITRDDAEVARATALRGDLP
jgi:Tfp pilus assembly protein PilV